MLGDLSNAVGDYLHDVFIAIGLVGSARLRRAGVLHRALCRAMDRLRTGRPERDSGRVLVVLDRRRSVAAGLRALSPRSGVHPGQGIRRVRLSAQSIFRAARAEAGRCPRRYTLPRSGGGRFVTHFVASS